MAMLPEDVVTCNATFVIVALPRARAYSVRFAAVVKLAVGIVAPRKLGSTVATIPVDTWGNIVPVPVSVNPVALPVISVSLPAFAIVTADGALGIPISLVPSALA